MNRHIDMISLVIIWLIFVLYGIGKRKRVQGFSPNDSQVLKGCSAVEIMIGHLGLATRNIFLYPNRKAGILFVGIFMFISGYGVTYNFRHKKGYASSFLKKHLSKIIIPLILVYAIYSVVLFCVVGTDISLIITNFIPLVNWYVWEIILLYIVFYYLYKDGMHSRSNTYMVAILLVFIVVAYLLGFSNPWYGSTLCFGMGILYEQYGEKIDKCIQKRYGFSMLFLAIILVISCGLFFLMGNESFIGNVIGRNMASLSFCMLIILFLKKYQIGNKITRTLGKISYEIFLIHPFVISMFLPIENISEILYVYAVCIVTIVLSLIINQIIEYMFKFLRL